MRLELARSFITSPRRKRFLVLFFKKELLSSLSLDRDLIAVGLSGF